MSTEPKQERPAREATTPEPPYFVVIFTSVRASGDNGGDGYDEMAATMMALASQQPGYLGIESARGSDGLGITVSYWASEEAIRDWQSNSAHLVAQEHGKAQWYESYCVRVARVERAYARPSAPSCGVRRRGL